MVALPWGRLPSCRCCRYCDIVCEVVLGRDHNMYARTKRGNVFAWGRGLAGQLGLGATERDHDMPRRMGLAQGRNVTGVFVSHKGEVWLSCATRHSGTHRRTQRGRDHIVAQVDLEAGRPDTDDRTGNPLQLGEDTLGVLRRAEASKI